MAIPKTKKPIIERKTRLDIERAMKSASMMETPGVTPEEGSARNSVHTRPEKQEEKMNTTEKPKEERMAASPPPAQKKAVETSVPKGRVGRPPLVEGRSERITVWFRPEIKKRLKRALLQEKLSRDEQDQDIDQSLLVEEALVDWLKARNY